MIHLLFRRGHYEMACVKGTLAIRIEAVTEWRRTYEDKS